MAGTMISTEIVSALDSLWRVVRGHVPQVVLLALGAGVAQALAARYARLRTETENRRDTLHEFNEAFWEATDGAMDYSRRKYSLKNGLTIDQDPRHAIESGFLRAHCRMRGLAVRLVFFNSSAALLARYTDVTKHLEAMTALPAEELDTVKDSPGKLNELRSQHLKRATAAFADMSATMVNEIRPGTIRDKLPLWRRLMARRP